MISSEESVFVEKFGSEIEISKPIPPWLWEGQITFKKHPTLKLNFTIPPSEASSSTPGSGVHTLSTSQAAGGGGANTGNQSSASSSPSGSHHGGTAVVFPGQGDNGRQSGGGSGQLVNSSSGNSISSIGSTGSATVGTAGTRLNSNISTTSVAASVSGSVLMNHASRSSAKGASRDRPGTSKSNIRTDLQGQSNFGPRSNSIATPTTAAQALVRGKRAIVGPQGSIVGGGGPSAAMAGGGDRGLTETSGLGVRMNSGVEGSSGANEGGFDANGQEKSAVISITHDQGDRDQSSTTSAGKESDSTTKETNTNTTNTTSNTQERTSGTKNSPSSTPTAVVVPEVVDEYYEVSMTLKALSLEGADF